MIMIGARRGEGRVDARGGGGGGGGESMNKKILCGGG